MHILLNIQMLPPEKESNYDEDEFENEAPEKEFMDPVLFDKVKASFDNLRLILQIKKIARKDCLKFILHGAKENGRRVRNVSIECL